MTGLRERLRHLDPHWLAAVTFTVVLLGLIAFAAHDPRVLTFPALIAVAVVAVAGFYLLFPGSRFFSLALSNFLGVYACIFVFIMDTNFKPVSGIAVPVGFALPVLAFLAGTWWRREAIRRIVTTKRVRDERHLGRVFLWLVPVVAIGALTFMLPGAGLSPGAYRGAFLVAMAAIAALVFAVSREVCTFLLDSALVFDEFFIRISGLVVPAFAFLTFYSLAVIVFSALFRVFDIVSEGPHFMIGSVSRDITFAESLYFSVITLSTVGYGDIVPLTNLVRVTVAVEIVTGVLLLLFGFSEIIGYAREHRRRGED